MIYRAAPCWGGIIRSAEKEFPFRSAGLLVYSMVSRDYRKEIGADTGEKRVSKPVAYTIIAVLAIGVFFVIRSMPPAKSHHGSQPPAAAAH